ncbi:fumarylacetoacetate hydrolase family protein [Lacticaseibacillus baoqingensis]|uniref:Fumarylacetoacetate hydrolase family protein n=1 Tax=Lacticaseibacillus baoqingensis TaxID=2486013 RepID=A0ABW4E801_9LACO|nr:fumarylacetoacetate hydrolase family protein [Lacticaseibacillus baoqingensis]
MKIARLHHQPLVLTGDHTGQAITNFEDVLAAQQAGRDAWQLGVEQAFKDSELQAPITHPGQLFAIGMNFAAHSQELHFAIPKTPSIFTKFASAITGPVANVQMHGPRTDWETELVVLIGTGGRNIAVADAPAHIAGYMVGEDLSDRDVQMANDPAQFSLGKSFENFAPIGPWLTTPDEIADLKALTITTKVNDVVMQHAPLAQMIFDPAALIHYLSQIVALQPGDLLFMGTPVGTGVGHDPAIFLKPGDRLTGEVDGLGKLSLTFSE